MAATILEQILLNVQGGARLPMASAGATDAELDRVVSTILNTVDRSLAQITARATAAAASGTTADLSRLYAETVRALTEPLGDSEWIAPHGDAVSDEDEPGTEELSIEATSNSSTTESDSLGREELTELGEIEALLDSLRPERVEIDPKSNAGQVPLDEIQSMIELLK